MVEVKISCCIVVTEESELYGHEELDIGDLCEEDVVHVEEEAQSLSGSFFEGLNPTFDGVLRSHIFMECDVPPADEDSIRQRIKVVHYVSYDKGYQYDLPKRGWCIQTRAKALKVKIKPS
jgi:hypothetical protein